jgi:hypothetical protein
VYVYVIRNNSNKRKKEMLVDGNNLLLPLWENPHEVLPIQIYCECVYMFSKSFQNGSCAELFRSSGNRESKPTEKRNKTTKKFCGTQFSLFET